MLMVSSANSRTARNLSTARVYMPAGAPQGLGLQGEGFFQAVLLLLRGSRLWITVVSSSNVLRTCVSMQVLIAYCSRTLRAHCLSKLDKMYLFVSCLRVRVLRG
jgi:hypothetical protein